MRGRRTDLSEIQCGIARALGVIGDWWSLLIVRDAFRGLTRFGEFQKSLGLAKNILSARLKKLTEHGILRAVPEYESSPYKVYVLTEKGEGLATILVALWQWGEEHCFAEDELNRVLVDKRKGEPLAKLTLKTRKGRAIGLRDFAAVAKDAAPQ